MTTRKQHSHTRRKIAARWQELASAPSLLRSLAENVSSIARDALADANNLIVEHQIINLPRLPEAFDGLRVAQVSDVHHSPFLTIEQVEKCVQITNELNADLTVLTGDYVSHEVEYIAPVAAALGKLKAKNGVFAILGNHDHWTDAELMTNCLRDENITVFINEGLHFKRDGREIWLCGVDDATVDLDDLDKALRGSRVDDFKFLLCHNPTILPRAARADVDLIVSGHTHGGQVRLREKDADLLMPRNRNRASGLLQQGNTQIYISRGIGTVVLPVRYQCPPEITLLELRSGGLWS